MEPFRLVELAAPAGGALGSMYVDKNFELFIEELITTPHFIEFRKTPYYIDIMESWERVKVGFEADETSPRSMNLSLIAEALPNVNINFRERIDTHNHAHDKELKLQGKLPCRLACSMCRLAFSMCRLAFSMCRLAFSMCRLTFSMYRLLYQVTYKPLAWITGNFILKIPPALIKEWHEVIFKKIVEKVLQLCNTHKPAYIFMVGGFSESDYMQHTFRGMLETPTRKLIVPMRPGLAGTQRHPVCLSVCRHCVYNIGPTLLYW